MTTMTKCECCDTGCPVDHGSIHACTKVATERLFRVDMESGAIPMCEGCADDAMLSGLFCSDAYSDVEP